MKCCIDCEKRIPGCHDTCEDYITGSKAERERKEKIRRAKEDERANRNYIHEHYDAIRRKHG